MTLRTATSGLDYFHAIKSVPCHSRGGAGFQDVPRCSEQDLRVKSTSVSLSAAQQRIRHHDDREYSAFDLSPDPVSGGHDLVQFEAREIVELTPFPRSKKAEREIGLPDSIATTFSGAAAEFRSSLTSEPYLILLQPSCVIYIVLGVLYESYIHHPITDAIDPAERGQSER